MTTEICRLKHSPMKHWFKLCTLLVCLSSIFFWGCAAPVATLKKEDFNVEKYKIVYLRAPDSQDGDPRNILPEVTSRLQKLGFTVITFNKNTPIIGNQGSGFVVDSRGYILTSAHIFNKEKKATVWLKGSRYEATVIKSDESKDIALLKIDGQQNLNLNALFIDSLQKYKMGQEVYTIGFPLSDILGNSPRLSKGLISSVVGLNDNADHLQVSAEIQSGNSGGPLLDVNGHVIGLIESTLNPIDILRKTGGNLPQNVNFAIKTNVIQKFIEEMNNEVKLNLAVAKKMDFDAVSESIAQVRAGNVSEDYLSQQKMVCRVVYSSFWDLYFRFRFFHIEFYDLKSGDLILKAGQYRYNMSTETAVLDETFRQIHEKFFPNKQ